MKVQEFSLNSEDQVVVKVIKEVLALFRIAVGSEEAEYRRMAVVNEQLPGEPVRVLTRLTLEDTAGQEQSWSLEGIGHPEEREGAAVHRLVKLNFYRLLRAHCGMPPAPWGILHGVRPTKIVHRYIAAGMDEAAILQRLAEDYEVGREKAELITQLSLRQRPFLAQTDDHTVSIYVGIPFCLSRCLYCSFPAYVLPPADELERFMAVFRRDLAAVAEAVRQYGFKVQSIYVGGGTPTSLPDAYFSDMLQLVYTTFYGLSTVEFTVEAGRPDSMSPAKIQTMLDCRVSRVSVNPQSMQEKTLHRIGRNHTPQDIVTMYHDLRAAGIPEINMDLIIGLPGETVADVEDTMRQIAALRPDDITLHALALKRGSRLKLHLEDFELPDDETAIAMFAAAMAAVKRLGLVPYYLYRQGYQSGQLENIGCCRPGAESMYNIQIMEEHQTILGIGGSATTKVVNPKTQRLKAAFNAKELTVYLDRIDTYIEKRAMLLAEAYGEQEEPHLC